MLYQEIVATSESFMRQCLVVEKEWIAPMLRKIEELDPPRLMGGKPLVRDATRAAILCCCCCSVFFSLGCLLCR